jgi:ATP-dependent Clp protease protease subunit
MTKFFNDVEIPVDLNTSGDPHYVFVNPETAFLMSGNVYLTGVVSEEKARSVIHQLNFLKNQKHIANIKLWIDNHGGYVHSAFSILNTMEMIDKPIITINMGIAYSAAGLILAHGTPGVRFVFPDSQTLLHCISFGAYGKEHEVEEEIRESKMNTERILTRLAKITGKSQESLSALMREDRYLTAREAIKWRFADKVVTKRIYKQLI